MRTDLKIASGVIALYALLVVLLLPMQEYVRALGGAVVVFGALAAISRAFDRRGIPGLSVLFVAFASATVLLIPTFPAMGGTRPRAVPIGFLGMQAAALLWVALCWKPSARRPALVSLKATLRFGLLAALGLSVIAAIPLLLLLLTRDPQGPRLLLVIPGYAIGMSAAAVVYWALQRIGHLGTGRYLIGALGGFCAYGAVGSVYTLVKHEPFDLDMMLVFASVAGGLVGPAVAVGFPVNDDAPAT